MSEQSDVKKDVVEGQCEESEVGKKEERREKEEGDKELPKKKKRRSRWDSDRVVAPSTDSSSTITTTNTTSVTEKTHEVDPVVAQQIAQQMLLQQQPQILTGPLGGITTPGLQAPTPFDCRIYVGSLHYDLKEADIKALFASFGNITGFTMSHDSITGKSKGYCFIDYETKEMAEAAMAMNQFMLAGRPIKVGRPLNGAPNAAPNVPVNPLASLVNVPIPPAPGTVQSSIPAMSTQAFISGLGSNTNAQNSSI